MGQYILGLSTINLCYNYISSSNDVSNDVVLSFNVLSFLVIPWIFGLHNRSTIITKQCDRNVLHSHNTKIRKKFLELNSFLCRFTSSNIFSFHGEVNNIGLLNTLPTYGSTSQGEYTTLNGPSEIKI